VTAVALEKGGELHSLVD